MSIPVAVIFSNTEWTFWNVMLLFFLFIPLLMLWFFAMFDVVGRRDFSGVHKALWILGILIFPWIGTFVYLIARPKDASSYESTDTGPSSLYGYGYGTSMTPSTQEAQMAALSSMHDSGKLSDQEYANMTGRISGKDSAS